MQVSTFVAHARYGLTLVLVGLVLASCGGPSPWGNWTVPFNKGLTQKNIQRLGGADEAFQAFKVGLLTDSQALPGYLRKVVKRLDKRNDLSFHFILGDLTDRSLRTEFIWVADVIDKSSRPILTVVGNHDGLIYGEAMYRNVFGELNYSFVYRGIKFIVWNNNPFEWGYPDFDWLHGEMESHPHVIVVAHQPPGNIDRFPDANARFREIYKHPHVLGSLHGHTHKFNYEQIEGKPVMTVANLAHEVYAIMEVQDNMQLVFERCRGSKCTLQD